MGKCSGLKGGGHQRKAIDVAEKKRNEKKSRKREQEAAGQRAMALQEILGGKLHGGDACADYDIYLEAEPRKDEDGACDVALCRTHFRREDCSNRRCKFSHDYSIAEALQNITSGTSDVGSDHEDGAPTIPALQYLPGLTGGERGGRRKRCPRRRREEEVAADVASLSLRFPSPLENALSEEVANAIVTYLGSDGDVLNVGLACRSLHQSVLIGSSGGDAEEGCKDVRRRKQRAREAALAQRNRALLASKAVGGRLRYAVVHAEADGAGGALPTAAKKKSRRKAVRGERGPPHADEGRRRRPVLVYDHENPHVYRAFREAALADRGHS